MRYYLSTARKQGHSLLSSLERALLVKPLPFHQTAKESVSPLQVREWLLSFTLKDVAVAE